MKNEQCHGESIQARVLSELELKEVSGGGSSGEGGPGTNGFCERTRTPCPPPGEK